MLLMGKSTISMAIFNSYVSLPEGKCVPNGSPMFPTSAVASATSATASHPQIPMVEAWWKHWPIGEPAKKTGISLAVVIFTH